MTIPMPPEPRPPRPLHLIWILDCSESMQGKRIESLNFAMLESVQPLREWADDNRQLRLVVSAVAFSDSADWHIKEPTDVHHFEWTDLSVGGKGKAMGSALSLVAEALNERVMPEAALCPVLVLISDGGPTDDFAAGLKSLLAQPWGEKSIRLAVAIGDEPDLNSFHKFTGTIRQILNATSFADVTLYLRHAATVREDDIF